MRWPVCGDGRFEAHKSERAEIKRMRVHPDYQGRGYGQLILDELEAVPAL